MERLARAIKLAAEYRQESYDYEKADKWQKDDETHDFDKCYRLSLQEAANKAAQEVGYDVQGVEPIYLLLQYSWNDILGWADYYLNKES